MEGFFCIYLHVKSIEVDISENNAVSNLIADSVDTNCRSQAMRKFLEQVVDFAIKMNGAVQKYI